MIDWLIAERSGLPPPGRFLAPPELERCVGLRTAKRRHDWLLGRWATKRLVRRHLARRGMEVALASIMVLNDSDGAPRLAPWGLALAAPQIVAELERLQISISHSGNRALCALISRPAPPSGPAHGLFGGAAPLAALGADIELIAARGAAFAEAYDTPQEVALLAAAPPERYDALATAIWSAKEATLKLTHDGLRVDTRAVSCLPVLPRAGGWAPITITTDLTPTPLWGWWQELNAYVITIVAAGYRERPAGAPMSDWEVFGEGEVAAFFALSE